MWQPWTDPENRASSVTTCHRTENCYFSGFIGRRRAASSSSGFGSRKHITAPSWRPQSTARLRLYLWPHSFIPSPCKSTPLLFIAASKVHKKLLIIPILQKHEICKMIKLLNKTIFCIKTFGTNVISKIDTFFGKSPKRWSLNAYLQKNPR